MMSTYIAYPADEAQDKAIRAFLEALQIPYEAEPSDETTHLLSTPANAERLTQAIANESLGQGREPGRHMEIIFEPAALEDLAHRKATNIGPVLQKIRSLLESIQQTPFAGIGKPEVLKHQLAGKWSRRITGEHRLVYKVEAGRVVVYQLRFHY